VGRSLILRPLAGVAKHLVDGVDDARALLGAEVDGRAVVDDLAARTMPLTMSPT